MKYDFESIIDRKGKDAIAIDMIGAGGGFAPGAPKEGFDAIPMWVADMNFPTCPEITERIIKRASHPCFGYFSESREYYDQIIRWHRLRHGIEGLESRHIGYENGVLGGVISAVNVLCSRGDNILLHSPTYIGFTSCLKNNGYNIIHSPLIRDDQGIWRMDISDMEEKIRKDHIHAAIFCSPHNPAGRVWERSELEEMMELFRKYDVYVISDEIWSDLILSGNRHIPLQSISDDARERTVALYAPSKTFNLAGLIGSYHIIYNDRLRQRVLKESSLSDYNSQSVLSMHALIGAYSDSGSEWVDELDQVLTDNVSYAYDQIKNHLEGFEAAMPQGTYMLFIDCSGWCSASGKTIDDLERACWDVGVAVQDGRMFHGPCHIRMNVALPRQRVEEAFRRLKEYVI